jgi:hypothetical protein
LARAEYTRAHLSGRYKRETPMRSTTNAPIARQKPVLQVTPVFRSTAAEIAELRFALDLCWQALDICEPVPENNGVGEIGARGGACRVPGADRLERAVNRIGL